MSADLALWIAQAVLAGATAGLVGGAIVAMAADRRARRGRPQAYRERGADA